MKIIVIYNRDSSGDAVVADSVKTSQAIAKNLAALGYKTALFELKKSLPPLPHCDVYFNQAWGIGSLVGEDKVADLLEKTGLPYTGATAAAIRLTEDKAKTKKILSSHGLLTPRFQTINLHFPVIVKPNAEDCSLGITQQSIFPEPILIEEYIEGRELNATLLGDEVLPISEIIFGPSFKNKYKIVDYDAKWEEKSAACKETPGVCPAKLSSKLRQKVADLAKKAYVITGCRDYARIDFRLAKDGTPYILEVNANPAIGPKDGAVRSAAAAGYSYPKFLEKIVKLAYARSSKA